MYFKTDTTEKEGSKEGDKDIKEGDKDIKDIKEGDEESKGDEGNKEDDDNEGGDDEEGEDDEDGGDQEMNDEGEEQSEGAEDKEVTMEASLDRFFSHTSKFTNGCSCFCLLSFDQGLCYTFLLWVLELHDLAGLESPDILKGSHKTGSIRL